MYVGTVTYDDKQIHPKCTRSIGLGLGLVLEPSRSIFILFYFQVHLSLQLPIVHMVCHQVMLLTLYQYRQHRKLPSIRPTKKDLVRNS